jgi:hypothetical protein
MNHKMRALLGLLASAILMLGMAAPASAGQPVVTRTVTHFDKSQHFDPVPECGLPGVTEYAVGTEHLVSVEDGDTLHVTYGEEFRVSVVVDGETIPIEERHGSDAISFQMVNNGSVTVFHESFHDQPNLVLGNVAFYTTFVAIDGVVKVDHFFGRNLPDEGGC